MNDGSICFEECLVIRVNYVMLNKIVSLGFVIDLVDDCVFFDLVNKKELFEVFLYFNFIEFIVL